MGHLSTLALAFMGSCICTTSVLALLRLAPQVMPIVFGVFFVAGMVTFRGIAVGPSWQELTRYERMFLGATLAIAMLRFLPYAMEYPVIGLVGSVNRDDNWHFQEIASLVNTERFPPRLNFRPDVYFHFYYAAWIPAAVVSVLAKLLFGQAMVKASFGAGVILLNLVAVWCLIVFVRHLLPEAARAWSLAAVFVAGAAFDMPQVLINLLLLGGVYRAEWWQMILMVDNQYSAFTSHLINVPHHLISGMAMLFAVAIATQPGSLAPRADLRAFVAAGVLFSFSLFSSVFAFIGGVVALLPLVPMFFRAEHRGKLAVLIVSTVLPSLPLLFIYLNSDAASGFIMGQPFNSWRAASGSIVVGVLGTVFAGLLMILEVGWLYVTGRSVDRASGGRLRDMATMSFLFLLTTMVISFAGSNNWSTRCTIIPVAVLCCYWAGVVAGKDDVWHTGRNWRFFSGPAEVGLLARYALPFAAVVHVNEIAVMAGGSMSALAFNKESAACKQSIQMINTLGHTGGGDVTALLAKAGCKDTFSAYHLEVRFVKPDLAPEDRELMGRGP